MYRKLLSFVLILGVFLHLQTAVSADVNTPLSNVPVTGSGVRSIVTNGTDVYVGGVFGYIGKNTGAGATVDITSGVADDVVSPVLSGTVYASVSDGSGGWYVGGSFSKVGTTTRNNIAHINSDGSLDANFNPNSNGTIYAMALSGSDLYVGGSFTTIGGQTRNRIAKLNTTNGNADGTFNPNASWTVEALAISGTDLYVGGQFNTIGGQTRNYIAKLNTTDGSADATFNPNANGTVFTLAFSGADLYIGGSFTNIGGQTRNRIAKLNTTNGNADGTFNPSSGNTVYSIAVSDSNLYVGGLFNIIGGQVRNYVAKLNTTNGSADSTFNPNADNQVEAVAISGSDLFVGGLFTTIGGQTRNYIAKLNTTSGAADSTFNKNASWYVYSLTISGSDLHVGGLFDSVGGVIRNYIAKFNKSTGEIDTTFNPNANGTVETLLLSGSSLYVGGSFTNIGGQTRNRIAKLNTTNGNADGTFNPNANGTVNTLFLSGSDLYVGGAFTTIGGQTRNRIAKLNTTNGNADGTFNPNATSGIVYSLVLSGSDLYVGGTFTTIGGQTRNRIAKLNTTNGNADGTFNPNANGSVSELNISSSDLYVGGDFTTIGGQSRNYVAKLNTTSGTADGTFNPSADGTVSELYLSGSDLYVGGSFTTIGGQSRNNIAKLNITNGSADTTFNPNMGAAVYDLEYSGTYLYSGGNFSTVGGLGYRSLVGFNTADTDGPAVTLSSLSPDPHTDSTPTFIGTATDLSGTVSSVQFQMDGTSGSWSSCTADDGTFDEASEAFTCSVSSTLSDSPHTIYVRSTDNSSNISTNSTDTFTIDTGGPSMTITALSPDPTTDTTPTFTGTATDGASTVSSVEYQIDGTSGSWSSCTSSDGAFDETSETYTCTTSILSQGVHTIYVRGTDSIANVTTVGTYASDIFTIDLAGPSISLNAVSPDPTTDTTPSVTGTATDGGLPIDYVQYQIDSTLGTWTDCTSNDGTFNELSEDFICTLTTSLSEAEHTIYIRSADTSGNSSQTQDTFTIDTTPSYINADYPSQDQYIRQQRPTFKFRASSGSTSQFSSYILTLRHTDTTTGEVTTAFTILDIPVNAPSVSTSNYTITSTGYSDTNADNDYIYITTKSSSIWDSSANNGLLKEGKNNWTMTAYETTGNTLSVGHDFYVDITNPQINGLSTNSLGIYEDYLLSTSTRPRISFNLLDNLLPSSYTVSIYRQNFFLGLETSRSLVLSESVTPDNAEGLLSIPVTYIPERTLPYGKYLLILTGFDKAENSTTSQSFRLQLLTADKAEELLKKPVKKTSEGVISLPELEKKAILRRKREARALEEFVKEVKKIAQSVDTSLLSSVPDLSQTFISTTNTSKQLLSSLVDNIDNTVSYLSQLSGLDRLSDIVKAPPISDRLISARQKEQKEVKTSIPKLTLNQDKVESKFKQRHSITNKRVQDAFNAANVALHSISEPVKDFKDATQRVVAGAETFYAIVFDKEPTKISNVTIEEIGTDYVTVSWQTNHPSTGKVNYGTNLSYGQEIHLNKYEKTHKARLTGMTPGKIYFFEVMSHGKNYTYDSFYTVETRIEKKD